MWSLLIFLSSLLSHFTTVSSLADNVPTDVGLGVDTSGLQAHENKLSTSATTIIDPLASSHGLSHTRLQPPGIECLVTVADENRSCAEDGRGSRVPSESEGSIPSTSSEIKTLPARKHPISNPSNIPRVVWVMWFGKPMAGSRLTSFESLVSNVGAKVILITETNYRDYEVPSWPMHPVIHLERGLSKIHKGDYLRVYFMHHHGGGYHDVKPHHKQDSWARAFDEITHDESIWMYGISERMENDIACDEYYATHTLNAICGEVKEPIHWDGDTRIGLCCNAVKSSYMSLLSNGAYIMRPGTPLTKEWLTMIESSLDAKASAIVSHPSPADRCCNAENKSNEGYPVRWAELHGEAFHPLQLKYKSLLKAGLPRWAEGPYRDRTETDMSK